MFYSTVNDLLILNLHMIQKAQMVVGTGRCSGWEMFVEAEGAKNRPLLSRICFLANLVMSAWVSTMVQMRNRPPLYAPSYCMPCSPAYFLPQRHGSYC